MAPAATADPYPRPDFVRSDLSWLSLNGPWSFIFDDADAGLVEQRWHLTGLPSKRSQLLQGITARLQVMLPSMFRRAQTAVIRAGQTAAELDCLSLKASSLGGTAIVSGAREPGQLLGLTAGFASTPARSQIQVRNANGKGSSLSVGNRSRGHHVGPVRLSTVSRKES